MHHFRAHANPSKGMAVPHGAPHIPCIATQMFFNQHVRGKVDTAAVHLLEKRK